VEFSANGEGDQRFRRCGAGSQTRSGEGLQLQNVFHNLAELVRSLGGWLVIV
jgi:hypothetical protein